VRSSHQEVAKRAKAFGSEGVLFEANIRAGLEDKINPFRSYVVPVRKARVEFYLRGKEDGRGRLIFTSRDRGVELRKVASAPRFLLGGELNG